jgi:hypothetical protein
VWSALLCCLRSALLCSAALNDISRLLNSTRIGQAVCEHNGEVICWSYVVERSGGNQGKLLGSTTGEILYNKATKQRLSATASTHFSIAQSARQLEENGWEPGYVNLTVNGPLMMGPIGGGAGGGGGGGGGGDGGGGGGGGGRVDRRYEAVATPFTENGLDWLIVGGQDIRCESGSIWVFGACEVCPSGEQPNRDGTLCESCPDGHSSENDQGDTVPGHCYRCPDGRKPNPSRTVCDQCDEAEAGVNGVCEVCNTLDGLFPNRRRTSCVCPAGTFALGLTQEEVGPKCEQCNVLRDAPHMGEGYHPKKEVLWEHPRHCPGGQPEETFICPQKGQPASQPASPVSKSQ